MTLTAVEGCFDILNVIVGEGLTDAFDQGNGDGFEEAGEVEGHDGSVLEEDLCAAARAFKGPLPGDFRVPKASYGLPAHGFLVGIRDVSAGVLGAEGVGADGFSFKDPLEDIVVALLNGLNFGEVRGRLQYVREQGEGGVDVGGDLEGLMNVGGDFNSHAGALSF